MQLFTRLVSEADRGEGAIGRGGLVAFFLGLLAFEALNFYGVLTFQVDYTWFGRMVSTAWVFGVLLLFEAVFRRFARSAVPVSAWVAGSALILMDFLGDVLHFYSRYGWYDNLAHFLSGPLLVSTFFGLYERLARRADWRLPASVLALLALGTDTIFTVLYESEEYLEDLAYGTHRLGDGFDTANDLLMNLVGGVLVLVAIASYRWIRPRLATAAAEE